MTAPATAAVKGFAGAAWAALMAKMGSQSTTAAAQAPSESKFQFAGGVAYASETDTATAQIGDGVTTPARTIVKAGGDITVQAVTGLQPNLTATGATEPSKADAKDEEPVPVTVNGAVGVAYGDYSQTANAYVNADANVDAQGAITVQAQAENQIDPNGFLGYSLFKAIEGINTPADFHSDAAASQVVGKNDDGT